MTSLEAQERRGDHHGEWVCFNYGGDPAIQAFFPSDMRAEDEFSVFWLGSGPATDFAGFMNDLTYSSDYYQIQARLIGRYGESTLLLTRESGDANPLQEINEFYGGSSANIGLLSATVEWKRSPASAPVSLYLWAAIDAMSPRDRNIEADDFREVGVKLTLSHWKDDQIRSNLNKLIRTTSIRGLPEDFDFSRFHDMVLSLADRYIEKRRLPR